MPDNSNQVGQLLGGLEFSNPRLRDLLQLLANDLYGLDRQINPPVVQSTNLNPGGNTVTVVAPSSFMSQVFNNNIRLSWIPGTTDILLYEIKLGSVYATATVLLTTATFSADIDPVSRFILTGFTYTFWITAVDANGNRSTPVSTNVAIPNISAPIITPLVLQNNVLLFWTIPTSTFVIDHYIVLRNGVFYGNASGTFQSIFEVSAGTFTYSVQAVDIVGNLGTPSPIITLTLGAPADFINSGTIVSTFTGTKVNCALDTPTKLIAPVNATETWNDHFNVNNTFATIAAQIAAGYPIYAEPAKNTATYTETFDFGAIFTNIIVSLNYNSTAIAGTVTLGFTISVSNDNITFDAPAAGTTRFASSVRYVKVVLTFTPTNDKSLVDFFNYTCNLNVHQETDSGTIAALSTDAGGTVVNLNKAFKSLNSITLSVLSTTEKKAVFDYTFSTLNPTTFKVLVFDAAGARVSATVGWIVKGVI